MPQQTPGQARVIDPVLTEIARGYRNANMVGLSLFPEVPVVVRGGKIIEFGKESLQLYDTERAPGAATKRVQFGYLGKTFALVQHSVEGLVPIENIQEASAGPGIDLGRGAVAEVQDIIALKTEKTMADLATTAGNYAAGNTVALAGASQWSDLANSDPVADIETAKETVRGKIGREPNTVVIGAAVMSKLKQNVKIIDRIKYTGRDAVTPAVLAAAFDVENVVVAKPVFADAGGALTDVWGKNVIVAYTNLASLASRGQPSFGYTYRLRGYPIVEEAYPSRNRKSWLYPVTDELSPVIAGSDAGYLIQAAVA